MFSESISHGLGPFERDQWRKRRVTTMDKPTVRIENWSVTGSVLFQDYRALEPGQRLTGDVFGHSNLRNGFICTSAILSIDLTRGLVETHNTVYQLGAVNQDYERWMTERGTPRAA